MKILLQITAVFIILITNTTAQIVNIETARMHTDSTGLMGDVYADFSVSKNTNEVFSVDLSSHLQYKTKKDLYLFLGSYGFLKIDGEEVINNTFFHFRYNRKLNKWLRWEAFTQLQQNTITGIESRFLLGTGPRCKILDKKFMKLYIASLMMYEREKETEETGTLHRGFRNSSYISLTIFPQSNFEVATTTFFQPLLKELSDYRILNQVGVKLKAGKHFALSLNWSYLFDSQPVETFQKVNYRLSTGLGYDF